MNINKLEYISFLSYIKKTKSSEIVNLSNGKKHTINHILKNNNVNKYLGNDLNMTETDVYELITHDSYVINSYNNSDFNVSDLLLIKALSLSSGRTLNLSFGDIYSMITSFGEIKTKEILLCIDFYYSYIINGIISDFNDEQGQVHIEGICSLLNKNMTIITLSNEIDANTIYEIFIDFYDDFTSPMLSDLLKNIFISKLSHEFIYDSAITYEHEEHSIVHTNYKYVINFKDEMINFIREILSKSIIILGYNITNASGQTFNI